jgi:hypothetical protein
VNRWDGIRVSVVATFDYGFGRVALALGQNIGNNSNRLRADLDSVATWNKALTPTRSRRSSRRPVPAGEVATI